MDEHHSIARETHRVSGRTANNANFSVQVPKTTQSYAALRFSMEGEQQTEQQAKPFSWAPGWNSNQSINQLTSQSVEADQFLDFSQLTPVTDQWLVLCESLSEVNFALQVPWYRGEWQSSLNPEFVLLNQENKVFISPKVMKDGQWQQGQWLTLSSSLFGENDNLVVAQAFEDERLSGDYLYAEINLSITDLKSTSITDSKENSETNSTGEINLSAASQQELLAYQQAFNDREQQSNTDKANVLARLKNQDQHIPIRLVSGGLDDV
jgi:NADH-quinone oxidoreductase subunit G